MDLHLNSKETAVLRLQVNTQRLRFTLETSALRKFQLINNYQHKYMLFAGWEVRMVKNCDLGLENTARGRRPRAAFSRPRSQFFIIRTDP